ncbi:hypothetical protein [Streptomyces sp. NBC_01207]|uniref:hypothetical protein n=1 Tax=Streptomyces sp. NBC_01207 TaxID=2903772 RepID=UPI002E0FC48E|nr:hypothetical protein OG457_00990 [Streptomyces sp. NBC_01207]
MTESVRWVLTRLPQDHRDRFQQVLADLAEAERDPGRRELSKALSFASGLVEEEPEESGRAEA